MITVTLVGADGSGKSTLAKKLLEVLQYPTVYIYMGENPQAATHMLPTTRFWSYLKQRNGAIDLGGPPDSSKIAPLPKAPIKRLLKELKSAIRVTNLVSEEWYRQLIIWYYRFRRYIVITDRHFYLDYYYHHIHPNGQQLTLAARIHGSILAKLYPKPGIVLYLDAPPEVLYARKREGSPELLESRRQEYINLSQAVKRFHALDATQPIEIVTQQATRLILAYIEGK